MKYRFSAWPLRLCAAVLALLCLGAGFLSGVITIICVGDGFYFGKEKPYQATWQCGETVREIGWEIIHQFRRDPGYQNWESILEDTDLRFILVDEFSGEVMAAYVDGLGIDVPDTLANNRYLYEYNSSMTLGEKGTILENIYVCDYYFGTTEDGGEWGDFSSGNGQWFTEMPQVPVQDKTSGTSYQILYLLPQVLSRHEGDEIWEEARVHELLWNWKEEAAIVFVGCLAGFAAALVFLLIQAGRKPGQEQLQVSWLGRIPTDVLLVLGAGAVILFMALLFGAIDLLNYSRNTVEELVLMLGLCTAGILVSGIVLLGMLHGCTCHLKLRNFWRSMLLVRLLAWLCRPCRKILGWLEGVFVQGWCAIGLVPRAVLCILAVLLCEFLLFLWLVYSWNSELPLAGIVLFNVCLGLALIWGAAQMKLLQKAAKTLADGELEQKLDTRYMYWEFKRHGEHLNAIAGGMSKAVEKQMKSERLKTELITNVSHDIKTPLTSIINYVDLLQKPHTEAEGIQYLEVLDRQAKRLQRLTENLVEASKASTGNLAVSLEPTSVVELVNQAVEEYRERLEAGKLEVITDVRGDLNVLADGKLLWRIMDNLLNNVVKYALAGTRVYVTAEKRGEQAVLAVKNISRDPLNMEAEELMERFVRGDSSRHTEGSGLGLNIARSLTELQNGRFDLTVDGDLFKAQITLPLHPK